MRWKTCTCPQWEEPRLYARAAQIVQRDPDPRRRLFEPVRTARPQPQTRQPSRAASTAPGLTVMPRSPSPASVWQSDFSDQSEWEQDWLADDDDELLPPLSAARSPSLGSMTPNLELNSNIVPIATSSVNQQRSPPAVGPASSKARDIDALMDLLRGDHECTHDKWRWVKGPHRCEECHHRLPSYIFECKQCMLQACNRCRRNRLR